MFNAVVDCRYSILPDPSFRKCQVPKIINAGFITFCIVEFMRGNVAD